MNTVSFPYAGETLTCIVCQGKYENGLTALWLETKDGEPFIDITTNFIDAENYILFDDEVIVKTWSENEPIIPALLESGLFEDTSRRVGINFVTASVWKYKGDSK